MTTNRKHAVRRFTPARFPRVLILSAALVALGLLSSGTRAASTQEPSENGIAPEARAQIEALLREKETRSPAEQKIDSQLLYARRMQQGLPVAPGVQTLEIELPLAPDGHVIVDVKANVSAKLLADLTGITSEMVQMSPGDLQLHAELNALEAIAAQPDVIFIQPKQGAMTSRVVPRTTKRRTPMTPAQLAAIQTAVQTFGQASSGPGVTGVGTGQGAVTSQGDITHRSAVFRGLTGFNGTGVRIGVLSDGVEHLADAQASGDLGAVTVLPGQAGSGDEGTAMLELIHDMAPGAELYFATAFTSITSFADNIRALRTAGCHIIVDDVGYYVETPFQDGQGPAVVSPTNGGVVTQAVKDVAALGAMYFSSAGNSGNLNDGTSGVWEGDFTLGAATGAPIPVGSAGNFHRFTGVQDFNTLTLAGAGPISLHWSDPLGASGNDYDIFRLNTAGTTVSTSSTNVQNGNDDPYEQMSSSTANPRIVIVRKTGAASRFLHLNTNRGELALATAGQIHGHAATSNIFTFGVAAAYTGFAHPNPFSTSNVVETFSSDGPRRVFYLGDGTAVTPGNFSSTGGAVLQKPDLTAGDGVFVTGAGDFAGTFFGTSAAAPAAAAIMALIKSANPGFNQTQLRSALFATSLDIEAAGVDRDSGIGIVMATPPQPGCTFTLAPPTVSPVVAGGPGSIAVTASSGSCNWPAWSNVPWITLTANVGTGSGSFNYTVDPNPGPARTGTITIQGGQIVTVNQAGLTATSFDNTTPLVIPDNTTVESSITVSGLTGSISNVTASFHLTHTFDADLVISLVGPDATIIPLSVENGGSANNYGTACSPLTSRTTFDDSAANYITHGSAPFTGRFRPEKPLTAFNGKSGAAANGTWKLRFVDGFAGDTGNLLCWSLNINTSTPVAPPTSLTATASTPTSVTVSWTPSAGATSYEVQRSAGGGVFENRGTIAGPPFADAASANIAYLYRVRVVAPVTTAFSGNDLATAIIFTDPALTSGMTVKAAHVTELRTAVNAVRVLSGAGALAFSDPTLTPPGSVMIKALHMSQLRGVLDVARAALGLPAAVYSFPATAGSLVRAADVNDLRNGVK
jgi:subtilisin-like proprotein convertase family protein